MTLSDHAEVLIIGAGPTGLAAALFLAERGVRARLVDKSEAPSTTSRAQVVNPRSLEVLQQAGVTDRILSESHPIGSVRFYEGWKDLSQLDFADIASPFAMSVLPQARTEALLAEALNRYGIVAERGVTFEGLEQTEDVVRTRLSRPDGETETVEVAFLLAADGAHSAVRTALNIGFEGHAFAEPWPLYDIQLNDPLPIDHAHVSFVKRGLLFLLCIRPGLWRVFGDVENLLDLLPSGTQAGDIQWRSSFHIADRLATAQVMGRVALAGDAAHIHSPVGARGMNLGIEDAYVFAACAADALQGVTSRFQDYGRLRGPVHRSVVNRMDKLTALARGRPDWVGTLRHFLIPGMTSFGPIEHRMRDFITGIDHPLKTN